MAEHLFDPDDAGYLAKNAPVRRGVTTLPTEFLLLLAPTVNSYTRLVKGAWAPGCNLGYRKPHCGIRVIPGDAHGQRIEVRVGGADANPYLVQAAALAAMEIGMSEGLLPDQRLPVTLMKQKSIWPPPHFAADLGSAANRLLNPAPLNGVSERPS